jgi:hypothetical protein
VTLEKKLKDSDRDLKIISRNARARTCQENPFVLYDDDEDEK